MPALSSTPGLCPSCSGPGCPRAPSLSSSHVLSGAWLALPCCGQTEVPTHRPTSLLAPTGVEGFTSQEDQELLSRIEKQLKRRFAIGSQVSEHSIIQDFTKQVGLQGRVPTHPIPCPALSRQAWDGVGAAVPGLQACPQCSPLGDFLCHIKGKGPGSEVLLGPPRLPQSFVSPFPYLPAFCGVGGAEPEGEPSSPLGTELLIP